MQNNETIFFTLIIIAIGIYFLYLVAQKFPRIHLFFSSLHSDGKNVKSQFSKALLSPMILKKMAFTLAIIVIFRLLHLVPIPFIAHTPQLFPTMHFLGHPLPGISFLNWALTSYLFACVFLQVLSFLIPFERKTQAKYTLITAFLICALFSAIGLKTYPIYDPVILFYPLSVLCAVAGLAVTLCLSSLITRYGVGQGITVLVSSTLFILLIQNTLHHLKPLLQNFNSNTSLLLWLIASTYVVILSIYMTRWKKNIPLGDKKHFLTLRLSSAGHLPLSWGAGAVGAIALIISVLIWVISNKQYNLLDFFHSAYHLPDYLFSVAMIFLISYFYYEGLFPKKRIERLLLKFGFSSDYLIFLEAIKKTSFSTAFYFSLLFVGPFAFAQFFDLSIFPLKGTAALIIIGGIFSIVQRIKALQRIHTSGCNKLCHIASDEIEAEIKKAYLAHNNIPCEIDPLNFTWGLPIRTALDEYRLYVEEKDLSKASEIFKN